MPVPKNHFIYVSDQLRYGGVVPFLGAGVNHAGRPQKKWQVSKKFFPDGTELAQYLAASYKFPGKPKNDLARVSQYIGMTGGDSLLRNKLRELFDRDYEPTPVHRFFAELPGILSSKGCRQCHQLIVTTNYDDLMERALDKAGEPFDVITYVGDLTRDDQQARFVHWPAGGSPVLIEKPNEHKLPVEERTIVLKIHGAVDRRPAPEWDSYVITEDDYITFMALTDKTNWIPAEVAARMRRSQFLFLGYGLRDWNLRVILHRLWGGQYKRKDPSWAIQFNVEKLDEQLWAKRNVELLDMDIEQYVVSLGKHIKQLPAIKSPAAKPAKHHV